MKRPQRKFARFYYAEFKRDYPDIYADDAAFSAWSRLLVASEESWPAQPELPRSIRPKALRTLTDRGLVTVRGHAFAIKGFAAERSARHEAAVAGALGRWDPDANAGAPPNGHANGHATAPADAMPSTKTSNEDEYENEKLHNAVDVERRPPRTSLAEPSGRTR